jgi:hypothetical protein
LVNRFYKSFLLTSAQQVDACKAFLDRNWQSMAQNKRWLTVEIEEKGKKRSSDQNRRFYALLRLIAENAWVEGRQYDVETWKMYLVKKHLGIDEVKLPDGTIVDRPISTVDLTVDEFNNFMTRIEADMAELGIIIEQR